MNESRRYYSKKSRRLSFDAGMLRSLVCLVILLMPFNASHASELLGVRFGPDGAKTRIVFDLNGVPSFDVSGDDTGKGRLIIDFENMRSDAAGLKGIRGKGHIERYVYAPNGNRSTRFVLEFARTARIDNIFVLEPQGNVKKYRLVVDLQSASMVDYISSLPRIARPSGSLSASLEAPSQASTRIKSPETIQNNSKVGNVPAKPIPLAPSLKPIARLDTIYANGRATSATNTREVSSGARAVTPAAQTVEQILRAEADREAEIADRIAKADQSQRQRRRNRKPPKKEQQSVANVKLTIVIDPGHGGSHPGAVGQKGTLEKDVNLAAAKALATHLAATGRYRPVLTRIDDRKVELERRAKIAREVNADLFISLHADGNNDHTLRGSSVYTISEEGTKRSIKEAREQESYKINNGDLADFDPLLGKMLFDVSQDRIKTESTKLAGMILPRVGKVTNLVKNAKRTEDLKVLLRPDVPAVLLEMAFISNKEDEENLINEAWRIKTMGAVALAIDDYFESKGDNLRQTTNRLATGGSAGGLN